VPRLAATNLHVLQTPSVWPKGWMPAGGKPLPSQNDVQYVPIRLAWQKTHLSVALAEAAIQAAASTLIS
jgi:hypothetical protein